MRKLNRRTLLIGAGATFVLAAGGGAVLMSLLPEELEARPVFSENGVAIRGTDPVSYFTEQKPVLGSEKFAADWNGTTWHFASADNRETFLADPDRYAPQYGGFCAWAVAEKGKLYSTQPQNWSIVDGKLYLNYNDGVQENWEKDIPGFIEEGDRRWPEVLATK
ncbi:MAG: YHS domain-containing (seleno)protein [Stappiaceae bacterium]